MGCIVVLTGQVGIPLEKIAFQVAARFSVRRIIDCEKQPETLRENFAESSSLADNADISILLLTRNPKDIIRIEEEYPSVKTIYFKANLYSRVKLLEKTESVLTREVEMSLEQEILQARADATCDLDRIEQASIETLASSLRLDKLFTTLNIHSSKKKLK